MPSYMVPAETSSTSSGCIDAIEPRLPDLILYLVNMSNDRRVSRTGPFILCYF